MWPLCIKLRGDIVFNLRFIFNPGSCGYFCLKYILKKKIVKQSYISLCKMKEVISSNGYYCSCLRLKNVTDIKTGCLSLIETKNNGKHYIVVKMIKKGKIYYYDPLFLLVRKKKIEYFIRKWSGICLFYTKV